MAALNLTLLAACALLAVGVAAVRFSARVGLPGLLLYLAIGLAVGEAGLGLQFSDAGLVELVGTVLLAIILIDGGYSTSWSAIRPVLVPAVALATVGVAISIGVTAGLTLIVLDVELRTAVLLGAVVSSTDAAAVFAILRRLPLQERMRSLVEAESGLNDPLVIVVVSIVTSDAWESSTPLDMAVDATMQLVLGGVVGAAVALVGQWVLRRSALPASGLYPLATLAVALAAFALAGMAGGSGMLACYLAGLLLARAKLPHRTVSGGFLESLGWLAQISLFILLGLLASPARLVDAIVPALVVGSLLTLVARPVSVALVTAPFRMTLRERAFVMAAGLRGAVPIVLASIPMARGLPAADRIFDTVFLLVTAFTLLQGPLLLPIARRTGVEDTTALRELSTESAPLEGAGTALVQVEVPARSRLIGLLPDELRLPHPAVLALLVREGRVTPPRPHEPIRRHDHLLVACPEELQGELERRLDELHAWGRLAGWAAGSESASARRGAHRGAHHGRPERPVVTASPRPPETRSWERASAGVSTEDQISAWGRLLRRRRRPH